MTTTLTELETYLKPLAQYHLVIQVAEESHQPGATTRLSVIDEDIFQFEDDDGVMQDGDASVCVCNLLLNEDNTVVAIDHSYGLFTAVNKRDTLLLINLIGTTITLS